MRCIRLPTKPPVSARVEFLAGDVWFAMTWKRLPPSEKPSDAVMGARRGEWCPSNRGLPRLVPDTGAWRNARSCSRHTLSANGGYRQVSGGRSCRCLYLHHGLKTPFNICICSLRKLIPRSSVQGSTVAPGAGFLLDLPAARTSGEDLELPAGPPPPLFEMEGNARVDTLVSDRADPGGTNWAGPGSAFTAGDHTVDTREVYVPKWAQQRLKAEEFGVCVRRYSADCRSDTSSFCFRQ